MKTEKQIAAEIAALEKCKTYAPRRTVFGDDNHRKIDLQIEQLRYGIDDTSDEWNEYSDDEQSAICEARDWMEGDQKESMSSGWDHFKPNAKKRKAKK